MRTCPFCASSNIDDSCGDVEDKPDGKRFYFVFCNRCEATGPTSYEQEDAINMWNERRDDEDD